MIRFALCLLAIANLVIAAALLNQGKSVVLNVAIAAFLLLAASRRT